MPGSDHLMSKRRNVVRLFSNKWFLLGFASMLCSMGCAFLLNYHIERYGEPDQIYLLLRTLPLSLFVIFLFARRIVGKLFVRKEQEALAKTEAQKITPRQLLFFAAFSLLFINDWFTKRANEGKDLIASYQTPSYQWKFAVFTLFLSLNILCLFGCYEECYKRSVNFYHGKIKSRRK